MFSPSPRDVNNWLVTFYVNGNIHWSYVDLDKNDSRSFGNHIFGRFLLCTSKYWRPHLNWPVRYRDIKGQNLTLKKVGQGQMMILHKNSLCTKVSEYISLVQIWPVVAEIQPFQILDLMVIFKVKVIYKVKEKSYQPTETFLNVSICRLQISEKTIQISLELTEE